MTSLVMNSCAVAEIMRWSSDRRSGEKTSAVSRHQPRAAAEIRECFGCHVIPPSLDLITGPHPSNSAAAPMPPPTHSVTRPYRSPRRRISCSSVVVRRAPLQPSGWPSAIAPPLTFSRARSIGSSRRHASTCAANASFSSTRSIRSSGIESRASSLRTAGTGPMPKRSGSTPAVA